MMTHTPHLRRLLVVGAMGLVLSLGTVPAWAHCDSEDGPIIPAVRAALSDGNLTPVLKWIAPADEPEMTALFGEVRQLRAQSESARAIADRLFIETFIRVHRAAEGAPFTGIKPAGAVAPILAEADEALAEGKIDALAEHMSAAVRDAIVERFHHAATLGARQNESVTQGREFVAAYVDYIHFVEGLHDYLNAPAGHAHEHGAVESEDSHSTSNHTRSHAMSPIQSDATVGGIVTAEPQLSRVFEEYGIDYCCGGKVPLAEACRRRNLDTDEVIARLESERGRAAAGAAAIDAAAMSLTALADHIEQTHHTYLRAELPRLQAMAQKVASVHGERDPRLAAVRDTVGALAAELSSHMMKEERILFPMIRQMEGHPSRAADSAIMIAGPIRQMESEHDDAGANLERLTTLTDGYNPPEWACNTYRALLDGLQQFEADLHQHIHKENNVLFPRALNGEVMAGRP